MISLLPLLACISPTPVLQSPPSVVSPSLDNVSRAIPKEMIFVENRGQWPASVKFLGRSPGVNIWIGQSGLTYQYYRPKPAARQVAPPATPGKLNFALGGHAGIKARYNLGPEFDKTPAQIESENVRVSFVGASGHSSALGGKENPYYENYLIGNDRSKWASGVRTFKSATIANLYKGIDLVVYADPKRHLPRYDLVVHPGADLSKIAMRYEGAQNLRLAANGSLVYDTHFGKIQERDLVAYQSSESNHGSSVTGVTARLCMNRSGNVGFRIGNRDKRRDLVIDPLVYSTFVGGYFNSYQSDWQVGLAIASDMAGSAYVTGTSVYQGMSELATSPGAFQAQTPSTSSGTSYVAKLSPGGGSLIFATYLGGSTHDTAFGIGVDSLGQPTIVGTTKSKDFPTTVTSFQPKYQAGSNYGEDAFIAKLSKDGKKLIFGSYLGGTGDDIATSCAFDSAGNSYLAGWTSSFDFPVSKGAFQIVGNGDNAFVAKVSADGTQLQYSTLLGGSQNGSTAYGIAVDSLGSAYVAGNTSCTDFPVTVGAFQPYTDGNDGFITKLGPKGDSLVYSTFFGGVKPDTIYGIAIDSSRAAYVTGLTLSDDFPVSPQGFQPSRSGGIDSFAAKLSSDGSTLVYGSYLGGQTDEQGNAIAVDASGAALIGGQTNSSNFPTTSGTIRKYGGYRDAFVSKVSIDGSSILYSTLLGGDHDDSGQALALDSVGQVFLLADSYSGGTTNGNASNYPTTPGGYITNSWGAVVTRLIASDLIHLTTTPATIAANSVGTGTITLWQPARAGGLVVNLTSSLPAVVTVPTSVTVPAGQSGITFQYRSHPVFQTTGVVLTAASSWGTAYSSFHVQSPPLDSFDTSAYAGTIGDQLLGTVSLAQVVPGNVVVNLSSSDPSITVPTSTVITGAHLSTTFPVNVVQSTDQPFTVTLNAWIPGSKTDINNPIPVNVTVQSPFQLTQGTKGSDANGKFVTLHVELYHSWTTDTAVSLTPGSTVTIQGDKGLIAGTTTITVPKGKTGVDFKAYQRTSAATTGKVTATAFILSRIANITW